MLFFVYGGSGSGKSAFAEKLLQGFDDINERIYIATMRPDGEEAGERIRRHQAARADKGFITVERYSALEELRLGADCAALLECLGNLVANELFGAGEPRADAKSAVLRGVESLRAQAQHLIVVSNDVGGDGQEYPPQTRAYQQLLAELNRRLLSLSDVGVEMVCGIPIFLKGESLCGCFVR